MGFRSVSTNKMWKKDEMAALIALFESERCLYDDNDEDFHDEDTQMEAYKRICKVMLRIRPDCSVDEIKQKFKFLRRQYAGELIHRNISVKAGICTKETYKPAMWCFGLLQFLDDFVQEKNNAPELPEKRQGSEMCFEVVRNPLKAIDSGSQSFCLPKTKKEVGVSSDAVDESDDQEDTDEQKINRKKRKQDSSSSEREMLNTSSSVKKIHSSSSEKKLQSASSERKFHNISSVRKFQNTSTVKKFQSTSSGKKLQNTFSSERKFLTSSPSEKKLQNISSVERKLQNSSSSEMEFNMSSSSERELKNISLSAERELKNASSSEKELESATGSQKSLDAIGNVSAQSIADREDIFGQYVASELRALRSNPLLYLQTKQSILENLTSANFELINPE